MLNVRSWSLRHKFPWLYNFTARLGHAPTPFGRRPYAHPVVYPPQPYVNNASMLDLDSVGVVSIRSEKDEERIGRRDTTGEAWRQQG